MTGQAREQIANRLAEVRGRRGLSASQLAALAGVSRQTIYAVEANNYMPNTALALRLARALEVPVEDLFQLAAPAPPSRETVDVELIFEDSSLKAGQPVQLCPIGGATIAVPSPLVPIYLPAADGVLADRTGQRKLRRSAVLLDKDPLPTRLLVAGCDPALSVLAAHARTAGVDLALAGCNSSRALELLKSGRIHIAGTHLHDAASGGTNTPAIQKMFKPETIQVVTFASWEQGFVVASGNPKRIRSVDDLARRGVRFVNRERGAGSRLLLDLELKRAGIRSEMVSGYDRLAAGHLPAAWHIACGLADCCVATQAAARIFGLDFVSLRSERFDFVIPQELAASPQIQRILDAMQKSTFRRQLEILGGYDTAHTGQVVT
jgi:molybdate-binding protein/DNA-binding XRE family transcriptional regulator